MEHRVGLECHVHWGPMADHAVRMSGLTTPARVRDVGYRTRMKWKDDGKLSGNTSG